MTGSTKDRPTVNARPTKRFFVNMLTRDIELVPAIVDLVDNSVDGAKRLAQRRNEGTSPEVHDDDATADDLADAPVHALTDHQVDIIVGPDRFAIEDDCGGIPLQDAIDYAFRFGRHEDVDPMDGEVGQFGVGMKRALFKLGQHFRVMSIAPESEFVVDVNVGEWLGDPENWTFPLESSNTKAADADVSGGTRIEVDDLLPSVAVEFGDERFLQRLRDQIEFRHQAALAAGLTITLNGTPLRSLTIGLLSGPGISPRVTEKDLEAADQTVTMRLYSGFVRLNDEDADTDNPDAFGGGNRAGWYLICNGRMLLFADRTRLTGWGQEIAEYHPQYRRFRGYVYLSGNSSAMPWNTAKTTVDEDSPIWQLVRSEIVTALREARTVMNRIKTEVQERPADQRPITAKLAAAREVSLTRLEPSATMTVPAPPPRLPPSTKTINYTIDIESFEEVRMQLQASSASEVGRATFSYYYRREID